MHTGASMPATVHRGLHIVNRNDGSLATLSQKNAALLMSSAMPAPDTLSRRAAERCLSETGEFAIHHGARFERV